MFTSGMLINQRYRLEDEIGRGGIGIIYRAYDTLLERLVAVKVLHTTGQGSEGRANILREAQIIARLNHPNIITVFDAGEVLEAPYLVMQLINGTPLDAVIPIPVEQIHGFFAQICSALEYAHTQGIVHRDLKPSNLLLEQNGRIMLMDFGLARSTASRMSVEGVITGTFLYMAPEQALGKPVDARTDLYSLGVILYEMATGEPPFTGDDPIAIITQHLYAPVVPPCLKNEALPIALNDLILRLLSKEPADRPASAADALAILEGELSGDIETVQAAEELSILERIVRGRLVARQSELSEAEKQWSRAKSGERQVLLLSGEPGIGKTRLVQEIVTRAEVSGGIALVGESYAEGGTPYTPFSQIARSALLGVQAATDFPVYILADLLALAPDQHLRFPTIQPNPPLDPKADQARLFENLVTWCQLLSEKKPLLIVLEDAHWADSGSLNLLHQLIRRTRSLPVLFVLTYRELELSEQLPLQGLLVDLNRERIGVSLKLKRLDEHGTEAMLATLFAEEITPDFLSEIYIATEGNPFFIEEVCKALVESGQVYYQDGRWQRPAMEIIHIPQSVRLAIQARLAKLPEPVQEILHTAALIGREFAIELLQAVCGLEEDQLIDAIEASESSHFIQELSPTDGLSYQFTHALFQATLVEEIHTLRRRRMHRRIAETLQHLHPDHYEALAFHFTEGGDDQQAYSYLILAGRKAAAVLSNAEAEEYFLAALNLVENESEKAGLLVELAGVRNFLGKFIPSRNDFQAAAEIYHQQDNLDQAAMAYRAAARASWDGGDTPGSLALAFNGLEKVAGLQEGQGLASLLSEAGRICYFSGQKETGLSYVQQAMQLAEQAGYADVLSDSLINLALLKTWSKESVDYLERAVKIAEEHALYSQLQRALNNLCILYEMLLGDFQKSSDCAKRGILAARQRNDLAQELSMIGKYLDAILELGDYSTAREILPRAHRLQESLPPDSFSLRSIQASEGLYLHHTGQIESALQVFEQLRQLSLESQDIQNIIGTNFHLAEIYNQLGDNTQLKRALDQGLEYGKLLPPVFEPLMYSMLVTLHSREGQLEEAAGILDRLADHDYPSLAPNLDEIPLDIAHAEFAIARQEWDQAWTAYAKAVQQLHTMKLPFREAQALRDWAAGLQKRGEPEDYRQARTLLEQAHEIYTRLSLDTYAEQVRRKIKNRP